LSARTSYEVGFGTVRPSQGDPSWGQKYIDDVLTKYCILDPHSKEGQIKIAQENGFIDEWNGVAAKFKDTDSPSLRYFHLFIEYAKAHERRKYTLHPREGLHREAGLLEAFFCSSIDPETGRLNGYETLTVQDFIDVGLVPRTEDIDDDTIKDAFHKLDDLGKKDPFFHSFISLEVSWVKDFDVDIPRLLAAERIISFQHMINKKHSTTKSTISTIGSGIVTFMKSISDESLSYDPDFGHLGWFDGYPVRKESAKKTEPIESAEKRPYDYPYHSIALLHTQQFVDFCKDPTNNTNRLAWMKQLTVHAVSRDTNKQDLPTLQPPFIPTWSNMAVCEKLLSPDTNEAFHVVNAYQANCMAFAPVIIHTLLADLRNKSLAQMAEDDEAHKMCMYFLRHHIHPVGVLNLKPHPSLVKHYKLKPATNTAIVQKPYPVFAATIFIIDLINAALSTIQRPKKRLNVSDMRSILNMIADQIGDIFSTIDYTCNNPSTSNIVDALGKICALDNTIVQLYCLTQPIVDQSILINIEAAMCLATSELVEEMVKKCQKSSRVYAPLKEGKKASDKSAHVDDYTSRNLLVVCMHRGVIIELITVLRHVSLFPQANTVMKTTIPVLSLMNDCLVLNEQDSKDAFDDFLALVASASAWSNTANRFFKPISFKHATPNSISLLPYLLLFLALEVKKDEEPRQYFRGGYYHGCYTDTKRNWNNLFLSKEVFGDANRQARSWTSVSLNIGDHMIFPSPIALACFIRKSSAREGAALTPYIDSFKQWRDRDPDEPYVNVQEILEPMAAANEEKKKGKAGNKFNKTELKTRIQSLKVSLEAVRAKHGQDPAVAAVMVQFDNLVEYADADAKPKKTVAKKAAKTVEDQPEIAHSSSEESEYEQTQFDFIARTRQGMYGIPSQYIYIYIYLIN
jgi:hypothetical protein